jgi:hypothetical protein
MKKLMLLCVVTSAISGCAHQQKAPPLIDGVCGAFSIINPSRADTPGTKRQVLAHNEIYRATCTKR